MPKPKGSPKTGGRRAGTPNKRTAEINAKLEELGVDPIEGMAIIAKESLTMLKSAENFREKIDAMKLAGGMYSELAQYQAPKRKAIDHGAQEGGKVTLLIEG